MQQSRHAASEKQPPAGPNAEQGTQIVHLPYGLSSTLGCARNSAVIVS